MFASPHQGRELLVIEFGINRLPGASNIAKTAITQAKKSVPKLQLANVITSINNFKKKNPSSNRTVTGSLPGSLQGQEMIKAKEKVFKKLRQNKRVAQTLFLFPPSVFAMKEF